MRRRRIVDNVGMEHESQPADAKSVHRDGFAAIAMMAITALLIAFIVYQVV